MINWKRDLWDRLAPSLTAHPMDREATIALLRAGMPVTLAMAKRRRNLEQITVTQRYWQARTRRGTFPPIHKGRPGRHHDSWAIREKYVRCHNTEQGEA